MCLLVLDTCTLSHRNFERSVVINNRNIYCILTERVGAIQPTSDAKRFKGEDETESDMEEEVDTEQKQVGLQQENQDGIEPVTSKAQSDTADIEKKAAAVRAGKSLEERQKEFHEMLLERGVCNVHV